jgi:hypothetical protein
MLQVNKAINYHATRGSLIVIIIRLKKPYNYFAMREEP